MTTDPHEITRFEEPWHAQLFSLTVALNEAGFFDWAEWAETFGALLRAHGLSRELDGGADYFTAWLAALENLLARRALAAPDLVEALRKAWDLAYLSTPHGAPIRLADEPATP